VTAEGGNSYDIRGPSVLICPRTAVIPLQTLQFSDLQTLTSLKSEHISGYSADLRLTSPTKATTYNHPPPDLTDLQHLGPTFFRSTHINKLPAQLNIPPPTPTSVSTQHVFQRSGRLRQIAPRRRLLQHQGPKIRHVQGQRTLSAQTPQLHISHYQ
jgi:hypothetical protein